MKWDTFVIISMNTVAATVPKDTSNEMGCLCYDFKWI